MKRYSIMVIESLGNGRERELCQCESHPEPVAKAASQQFILVEGAGPRRKRMPKYTSVRIVKNKP